MDAAQVKAFATELETTLGLLGELSRELTRPDSPWPTSPRAAELVARLAGCSSLPELPAVLLRAHAEITGIRGELRLTREALEAHALERIRETKHKLSDVTTTTESATLELMDGLDRAIELIDRLETQSAGTAPADGFQHLRRQVSTLYTHLQFQDITAQQLQGVSHALQDLELRVAGVAALFGDVPAEARAPANPAPASPHLPFNPEATMKRSPADQAMVDAAFHGARHSAPTARGRRSDTGRA